MGEGGERAPHIATAGHLLPARGLPLPGGGGCGQGARTPRSGLRAPQFRVGERGVPGQASLGARDGVALAFPGGRDPRERAPGPPLLPASMAKPAGLHASRARRLPPPPSGPAPLSRVARVSWCRQRGRLIIDRLDCPRLCQQAAPRAPRRWGPNLRAPASLAASAGPAPGGPPGRKPSWRRVGGGKQPRPNWERAGGDWGKPESTAGCICGQKRPWGSELPNPPFYFAQQDKPEIQIVI